MGAISNKHGFVYIEIPKTASRSMLHVLTTYYAAFWVRNERIGDMGLSSFAVVRDPYTRCLSLWWSIYSTKGDRYGLDWIAKQGLVEFIEFFCHKDSSKAHFRHASLLLRPQWQILQDHPVLRYVRFESLEEDFKALSFYTGEPEQFPVLNCKPKERGPDEEYLTPEAIKAINKWCAPEFPLLGYEKR